LLDELIKQSVLAVVGGPDSDVVAEGRFTTSWVHQGYLETQVSMAELDEDGVERLFAAMGPQSMMSNPL